MLNSYRILVGVVLSIGDVGSSENQSLEETGKDRCKSVTVPQL